MKRLCCLPFWCVLLSPRPRRCELYPLLIVPASLSAVTRQAMCSLRDIHTTRNSDPACYVIALRLTGHTRFVLR